ncbi:MAG TPA: hypothetical protein VND20_11360 [Candidatus Binataceae bacterium]|nr:hypothetical protein [Candidatus Binataceae bacterium]
MKRFPVLLLSFLLVAVFDRLLVAALLAQSAEVNPADQAVTIPTPCTAAMDLRANLMFGRADGIGGGVNGTPDR